MPTNQAAYAGQLRFRMRFDKQVAASADGGIVPGNWTEQFTRWADVRPMRGGENVQANRLVGKQPVLIIVRYDSLTNTIDSGWRAVELDGGIPVHYYDIKTSADMEREFMFITMVAVERDAQS